jgi:hypothetical protein
VHVVIETCANDDNFPSCLAVWFKDHRGLPSVCCCYPNVPSPPAYDQSRAFKGPGEYVWHGPIGYDMQSYVLVDPPTIPFGCPADSYCHLFLNGAENLTANADNELTFGSIDFGCTAWIPSFPTQKITIPENDSAGWSLTVGVTVEAPYPATVQIGYRVNGGAIQYEDIGGLDPNPDGSGTGTGGWDNVALNQGDLLEFFVKPPAGCTLRGANSGETTVIDIVGG